jgi:hypothetical protein
MALVGTSSLPMLLELFGAGKLDVSPMVTHGKRIQRSSPHIFVKGCADAGGFCKTSNSPRWKRHTTFLGGRQRRRL